MRRRICWHAAPRLKVCGLFPTGLIIIHLKMRSYKRTLYSLLDTSRTRSVFRASITKWIERGNLAQFNCCLLTGFNQQFWKQKKKPLIIWRRFRLTIINELVNLWLTGSIKIPKSSSLLIKKDSSSSVYWHSAKTQNVGPKVLSWMFR